MSVMRADAERLVLFPLTKMLMIIVRCKFGLVSHFVSDISLPIFFFRQTLKIHSQPLLLNWTTEGKRSSDSTKPSS